MRFYEFKKIFKEALEVKRKPDVSFRKSQLADIHIQQIVQKISNETGVSFDDLIKEMSTDIDKTTEIGKYSPKLYDTLILNSAENAAFDLIFKSKKAVNYDDSKFDIGIFRTLLKLVQYENSGFFPLIAPGEVKRIYHIAPILVPSSKEEYKKFNDVGTAAATPNGEFIFNVPFMEQLLYFGAAVDIQPEGKKYVANGGTIPNNYCYIEFLIMHELLHYAYGDFQSGRRFKQYTHVTHNWASDFRSNYLLVKSGYTQLPIGLFSAELHFDKPETSSYEKLVSVVDAELKKLPRQLQAWVEKQMEVDEHDNDEEQEWEPAIGEIVIHNKEGTFGRIVKINSDGTYETTPVPKETVEKMYPGIKVG